MNEYTYYLSANTSSGYTSFFDEIMNSFKKIIVIKNANQNAKEKIFTKISNILNENNISHHTIIRCGTANEVDCILIYELSLAITDEGLITTQIPLYSDVIDITDVCNCDLSVKKQISIINSKISRLKERMTSHLKEAKIIHDNWEKIYITNLDFNKINNECDELICNLLEHVPDSNVKGENTNRFFGTLLPRGNVNYIDELTKNLKKRIFIKGRPGTGKSTILKKIAKAATQKGLNTESYFCSLDVNSLDMLIVPELGISIFDSTPPHEKFPSLENDTVFDIYEIGKKINIDDYYSDELMIIQSQYNDEIKKAKECLYTALALRGELNRLIDTDDVSVENITNKILLMSSIKKRL